MAIIANYNRTITSLIRIRSLVKFNNALAFAATFTTNTKLVAINYVVDFLASNQNFTFKSIAIRQYHDIKLVNMNPYI